MSDENTNEVVKEISEGPLKNFAEEISIGIQKRRFERSYGTIPLKNNAREISKPTAKDKEYPRNSQSFFFKN